MSRNLEIKTERLYIREWRETDIEIYEALSTDVGYNVFSLPGYFLVKNKGEALEKIVLRISNFEKLGLGKFPMFDLQTKEFVGTCGMDPYTIDGKPEVELGYRLMLKHWGKGYATEAARAIVHYGFNELKLRRIIGFALEQNIQSLKILEKIGFKYLKMMEHVAYPIDCMKLQPQQIKALEWVSGILDRAQVQYRITGGLAAQAYGSDRPLNDIDIDVDENNFNKIIPLVTGHIVVGPERVSDGHWDLDLLTLKFENQSIDLGGIKNTLCFSAETQSWSKVEANLNEFERISISGKTFPFIPRSELLAYKALLARNVDVLDVANLTQTEPLWKKNGFFITTDRAQFNFKRLYDFLSKEAYWCMGIPESKVKKALENSLCFGVFEGQPHLGKQVGFARVVTDEATFAWVCDVYIEHEYRKKGLSKWLMSCVMAHPQLKGLRRICLTTKDAHSLYEKSGFSITKTPDYWMEIKSSGYENQ